MKKRDFQITKFGFYGFFKNLRFFDPVLLIYLSISGISTFQIGLLYSTRELIIYLFEIPSGVFADRYGKKTELIICFSFYIASFLLFALGLNFFVFALAMTLFGLGEAFRSGTHKAMIMHYLDIKQIKTSKSRIYGITRSYSMIGSMVSSLFTIYFIIALPNLKFLFFLAIIPYLLDMLLILSYPRELNDKKESHFSFKIFLKQNKESLAYVLKDKQMQYILLRSSSYQAVFKILKDFIQLILISIPITILLFKDISLEDQAQIYSAILYSIIFLLSAFATRNAYLLLKHFTPNNLTGIVWILTGLTSLLIGFFTQNMIIVFIGFILLYILMNIRKPVIVELIGNHSDPNRRASVLSIDSQLTSIFVIVFAPILGYISDNFSLSTTFVVVGILMLLIYGFTLSKTKSNTIKKDGQIT
jgi:MFS family permease